MISFNDKVSGFVRSTAWLTNVYLKAGLLSFSKEDLNIQLKFIKPRRDFFEAEVERLSKEITRVRQQKINLANFEEVASEVRNGLADMPDEERVVLVRLLVQKVWVDGESNVTIEFAIPESILALSNGHVEAGYSKYVGRQQIVAIIYRRAHLRR